MTTSNIDDSLQCSICGNSVSRATALFVGEGPACASCGADRTKAESKKLPTISKAALACALVPAFFGYSVTTTRGADYSAHAESIRLLLFTFGESSSGSVGLSDGNTGALTHSYFDYVSAAFGPIAMVLGAISLIAVLRAPGANRSRALVASIAALVVGAYQLLHGIGRI